MKRVRKWILLLLGVIWATLAFQATPPARATEFTVTNTLDSGAGSLRAAIDAANLEDTVTPHTITFAIPGAEPHTINLTEPLSVFEPMTIDATTQDGYALANTPVVKVLGMVDSFPLFDCFTVGSDADGTTIRGFAIGDCTDGIIDHISVGSTYELNYVGVDFDGVALIPNDVGIHLSGEGESMETTVANNLVSGNGTGISIDSVSDNVVSGNVIGLNALGDDALANGVGVELANADDNTIGGTTVAARNVISGNGAAISSFSSERNLIQGNYIGVRPDGTSPQGNTTGIGLDGDDATTIDGNVISANEGSGGVYVLGSTGTILAGNIIGLAADGDDPLGNSVGVYLDGATGTLIGGPTAADRNVISNNFTGILAEFGAGSTSIQGNYIGTDATGLLARGNFNGVELDSDGDTIVGNVISANRSSESPGNGLEIDASFENSGTLVEDNLIGTDATGLAPLGNEGDGIEAEGPNIVIAGNVISANDEFGIQFVEDANDAVVRGNMIGTNASGSEAMGNGDDGVVVRASAGVLIGGTTSEDGNLVSGNGGHGISVVGDCDVEGDGASTGTLIRNNGIGISGEGAEAIVFPNAEDGVFIGSCTESTTVGGTASEGNVISGNGGNGVQTDGDLDLITGNFIGTDAADTAGLGNGAGVVVTGDSITIGGPGAGNVISGNTGTGIDVSDDSLGTLVQSNRIGTNGAGTAPLANGGHGMFVSQDSTATTVGGAAAGEGNVISGNALDGVRTEGAGTGDVILGNLIGTAADGTTPLGNGENGVYIGSDPVVGGFGAGEANVIAFNGLAGVRVGDGVGTAIRGNSIHDNALLGIDIFGDGVTPNDPSDVDAGPNLVQNFPILSSVSGDSTPVISGTLNSTPSSTFAVDFYASPACDDSGNGEGATFLATIAVTTDGSGDAAFSTGFSPVSDQEAITAAATDAAGNTSEFSNCAALPPTVSIGDSELVEGGGAMSFTITLSEDVVGLNEAVIDWETAPGTATADLDYATSSGTVVIEEGSETTIVVPLLDDDVDESAETFSVNLTSVTGGAGPDGDAVIDDGEGIGTIVDDDVPAVSISEGAVLEGDAGITPMVFTVMSSAESTVDITVEFDTSDGTAEAGVDYVPNSGAATITAGETMTTITVGVIGDTGAELDETFTVNLSSPGGEGPPTFTIADGTGVGTITNDDAAPPALPTLSISNGGVIEGNSGSSPMAFTVTLGEPSALEVTVGFATSNASATAPGDYTATSGTLVIPAGSTSATIAVPVIGDTTAEANETFTVTLSSPTNATIADGSGIGTITNDDAPPPATTTTPPPTTTTLPPITTTTLPPPFQQPTTTTLPPTTTTEAPVIAPLNPEVNPTTTLRPVVTTRPPTVTTRTTLRPTTTSTPPTTAAPTTTSTAAPTTTTSTIPPPEFTLTALAPDGTGQGRPGVGLNINGEGYESCETVYFFFDGARIASDEPDSAGRVHPGEAEVPGDADPGSQPVISTCDDSGEPVRASTSFRVIEDSLHRSSLVTSGPKPSEIPLTLQRLANSAALAALLMLVFAFPSQLFNSTFEENYDEIRHWFPTPRRAIAAIAAIPNWIRTGGFFLIGGLVAAFLDPSIGFNLSTLGLVLGLAIAVVLVNLGFAAPRALYMRYQFGDRGEMRLLAGSILVGIVCVALSRALNFQPGYVYGLLAGFAFARQLDPRRHGRVTALTVVSVFIISMAAWFAWVPLSHAAEEPGAGLAVIAAEAALFGTFLYGLEALVIILLPLRFLAGSAVMAWSRTAWILMFGAATFGLIFVLLSPSTGYVGHSLAGSAVTMLIVAAAFMLFSIAFWAYFRLRSSRGTVQQIEF